MMYFTFSTLLYMYLTTLVCNVLVHSSSSLSSLFANDSGVQKLPDSTKPRDEYRERYQRRKLTAGTLPRIEPSGGQFYHPVGVTLSSADGEVVYYTTDGNDPTVSSKSVVSGAYIVVDETATLKAMAMPGVTVSGGTASSVVSVSFTIVAASRCGQAILVPYMNEVGHSGQLVRVDLDTSHFNTIELHGVKMDFANFYSSEGTSPYDFQLVTDDLGTKNPVGQLKGYRGGCNANINGVRYGYLAPSYNGIQFHGKAVQIQLANYGVTGVVTMCADVPLGATTPCIYTVLDLEAQNHLLRGFNGCFVHANKVYFVPFYSGTSQGPAASSILVSVDGATFSASSIQIVDVAVSAGDPEIGGFFGGFTVGNFAYLVPSRSYGGPIGAGINSHVGTDFGGFRFTTGTDAEIIAKWGRLTVFFGGKLVRVDLSTPTLLANAGVNVLDLTQIDPELRGFGGGFEVGRFIYLVPYKAKDWVNIHSSKLVRVDTENFTPTGVTILDLSSADEDLAGFIGGFAYGSTAVLVPHANGQVSENSRGRVESPKTALIDLNNFTKSGVTVIDLSTTKRQQVPPQGDRNLRGFAGGFCLGHHAYFSPHFTGVFSGTIARLDMRDAAALSVNGAVKYDGLQTLDVKTSNDNYSGFSGAFYDLDTDCVPEGIVWT